MHKLDSTDFADHVKLLLEMMTGNSKQESVNHENKDYIISSDESDIENEDNDKINENEQNFGNGRDCDTIFRLSKSYEDHASNTRKHLKPDTRKDAWNDFVFEDKMYRVIPLRLDEKIFKSKYTTSTNKSRFKQNDK